MDLDYEEIEFLNKIIVETTSCQYHQKPVGSRNVLCMSTSMSKFILAVSVVLGGVILPSHGGSSGLSLVSSYANTVN